MKFRTLPGVLLDISFQIYPDQWRKRLKFFLRSLLFYRTSRQWLERLDDLVPLNSLTRNHAHILEKPYRPYLDKSLRARQRAMLVLQHHETLNGRGWNALSFLENPQEHKVICKFDGCRGQHYEVHVQSASQFAKEGELTVSLMEQGYRLYAATFTLLDEEDTLTLFVGCLQGATGPHRRELINRATKNFHNTRPGLLMLFILKAMARHMLADNLGMVSSAKHVYRHLRKRRTISFDYDKFCIEQGFTATPNGHWISDLEIKHKALEDVPSSRRGEYQRKLHLKQDLQNQIKLFFNQLELMSE